MTASNDSRGDAGLPRALDLAADPLIAGPPQSICILRLSAIGDTCHVVPLIRSLQRQWPACRITWIIGAMEAKLMALLPGVEFLTVDKRHFTAAFARLRAALAQRRFDVLLHMHVSFRASLISTLVRTPIRLGFDRARARDFQWLFTNRRIRPRRREHVLDSFWGFAEALGVCARRLEWDLPLPPDAIEYARRVIPDAQPTLVISPCSSHALRNWRPEYYAAVADHAARRWRMRVVLCGGPTRIERSMADGILAAAGEAPADQVGRDTLPQMLALLGAATVLLSPDAGPAHMAAMVGTPVIGLYAPTNPARSGPYFSREWCVDRFPQAARTFLGREPDDLPWSVKIEKPGVMDLITPADVTDCLDRFLQRRNASPPRDAQ
jgi:heptosyltransferase I